MIERFREDDMNASYIEMIGSLRKRCVKRNNVK